jgi:hypothetical protein
MMDLSVSRLSSLPENLAAVYALLPGGGKKSLFQPGLKNGLARPLPFIKQS